MVGRVPQEWAQGISGKPNPFLYKPGLENNEFFNRPLFSKEQTQGAIDLASVKYQYDPEFQCGPRIACCTDRTKQNLDLQKQTNSGGCSTSVSWDTSTQLSFMRPRGNHSGSEEIPSQQSFSGLVFCNKPNKDPKILLINPQQTFNWLRHLMYSVNDQGRGNLAPDRILSTEALLEKSELSSIQNCHYFAVHAPNATKKDGKVSHHEQRVWTEPVKARAQVFSCSGNSKQ